MRFILVNGRPPPPILVCEVQSGGRNELPARIRDAPHLLRSGLLHGSLQRRHPAFLKSGNSIMNKPVFGAESARSGEGHYDENS